MSLIGRGYKEMQNRNKEEHGFSLIELLLVVVIIGIIAALAVPAYQKATRAAENSTTFATMRTIAQTQVGFYSQNSRFGRLNEVNAIVGHSLGTEVGDKIVRNKFTFEMNPVTPTDAELKEKYFISATRSVVGDDIVYRYELTQTGEIEQVFPL